MSTRHDKMNKKKGFTLVELLAVIIVIAIVAVITVPSILGVIERARKAAYKDTVYGIIDSAHIYLASTIGEYDENGMIEFVCNGISCSAKNGDKLNFKGQVPKQGSIYVKRDGSILVESLYNGKYYASNETGEVVVTDSATTLTNGELTNEIAVLKGQLLAQQAEINTLKSSDSTIKADMNSIKNSSLNIDSVYPIGSIYITTNDINPSSIFKGTTWEKYSRGTALIGEDGTTYKAGDIGGSSTVTLATTNLPSHSHTFTGTSKNYTSGNQSQGHTHSIPSLSGSTNTTGNHSHTLTSYLAGTTPAGGTTGGYAVSGGAGVVNWWNGNSTNTAGNHYHTVSTNASTTGGISANHTHTVAVTPEGTIGNTGSGESFSVQNPYTVVYIWKRTS